MSIVSKLFITTCVVGSFLLGTSPASAITVDLAGMGTTIAAGTAIPISFPTPPAGGIVAGGFDFDFTVGADAAHIKLLNDITSINLHVDSLQVQLGTDPGSFSYQLSDMNHDLLPGTNRTGSVGSYFAKNLFVHVSPINDPILRSTVEPGGYFHDIHFDMPTITDLSFVAPNAALVFNQDVEVGVSVVPEPGSFAAMGSLAMVGLGFGAFRRRKKARA